MQRKIAEKKESPQCFIVNLYWRWIVVTTGLYVKLAILQLTHIFDADYLKFIMLITL